MPASQRGLPDRPRVVVVGAGFGGLAVARQLENESVDVTIVDRNNFHTFQPLLYQVASAGLNPSDVAYVVRGVFHRSPNIDFRRGTVTGVDWTTRELLFDQDAPQPFDRLVVAAGSSPNFFDVPGAAEWGYPLYSLEDAARLRNHVLDRYERAHVHRELVEDGALNIVIVGGGPTGVEVAGAMSDLVENVLTKDFHVENPVHARIQLIQAGDALLEPFSERARRYARAELERRGVEVILGRQVERVEPSRVHLDGGDVIKAHTLIWAAGIRANALADALGLEQGHAGRIVVDPDLSVPGRDGVYAIGDVADIDNGEGGRLPQLAQVAIQGGQHVADGILAALDGRASRPFHYRDKGTMATIGRRAAVAELPNGMKLTGFVAWLAWGALHLVYLVGFRNRVSVVVNWAWQFFTFDRGPRLIFRVPTKRHPTSGESTVHDDPIAPHP